MNGIAVLKLPVELVGHYRQVVRVYDAGHFVAHAREFLSGISQKLEQPVVCVDNGEIGVEPAAKHRPWNVVI